MSLPSSAKMSCARSRAVGTWYEGTSAAVSRISTVGEAKSGSDALSYVAAGEAVAEALEARSGVVAFFFVVGVVVFELDAAAAAFIDADSAGEEDEEEEADEVEEEEEGADAGPGWMREDGSTCPVAMSEASNASSSDIVSRPSPR